MKIMRIYISGISGTAMGPLALMAHEAGMKVVGSDLSEGMITDELKRQGIEFKIGSQDGKFLQDCHDKEGIDWFVYTSALPKNHKELILAKKLGIKTSKRDEFIEYLVKKLELKMVAVAGTHGKTTTTAGIVWLARQLDLPACWLVGTNLGFDETGKYKKSAKYLIYEADEYDRNFLHYHPWLAVITSVSYDHPDIYPTEADYVAAFAQFVRQSRQTIAKTKLGKRLSLAGEVRRYDLGLAVEAIKKMVADLGLTGEKYEEPNLIKLADEFPGVGRRMEKLADGIYTDYAHHPEEIVATMEIAREETARTKKKGVVAVYEPHQNVRQHEVFDGYQKAFVGAEKLFWMPTYLTRENPNLPIIKPHEFIDSLENLEIAEEAEFNEKLFLRLKEYRDEGFLVLLMTAGPGDSWLREKFGS